MKQNSQSGEKGKNEGKTAPSFGKFKKWKQHCGVMQFS
jgi:hypothetical protein